MHLEFCQHLTNGLYSFIIYIFVGIHPSLPLLCPLLAVVIGLRIKNSFRDFLSYFPFKTFTFPIKSSTQAESHSGGKKSTTLELPFWPFRDWTLERFASYLYSWATKNVPLISHPFGFCRLPLKTFWYLSKLFKLTAPSKVSKMICGVCKEKRRHLEKRFPCGSGSMRGWRMRTGLPPIWRLPSLLTEELETFFFNLMEISPSFNCPIWMTDRMLSQPHHMLSVESNIMHEFNQYSTRLSHANCFRPAIFAHCINIRITIRWQTLDR